MLGFACESELMCSPVQMRDELADRRRDNRAASNDGADRQGQTGFRQWYTHDILPQRMGNDLLRHEAQ